MTDRRNTVFTHELATTRPNVIEIESMDRESAAENLQLPISPKALAFIVYTSGSIGEPKGVMWTHRNLLHHVRGCAQTRIDIAWTIESHCWHQAAADYEPVNW